MSSHTRAILWAQWRSWVNYYPRSNRTGSALGVALAALWYGIWLLIALIIFNVFSDAEATNLARTALPAGLLFVFVYWQLVPVLLASTGVSLELKKLQVYPIPHTELFLIELALRVTASFEMFLLMGGLGAGLLMNPALPKWAALGLIPFTIFNLATSAGTREILVRVMARKRIREIAVLLLVSVGAIPQLLFVTGAWAHVRQWLGGPSLLVWPWSATASVASGNFQLQAVGALLAWTAIAYIFGRRQFERTLRFDAAESNATRVQPAKAGWWDWLARWPGLLFNDPLAAVVEKEIRFLARAPRFRLVFMMGFTFGLVIWLPMSFDDDGTSSFLSRNYLTLVCVYALLLLGDVCFWNSLGFDRSAAQAYWALPVKFRTVLAGKNITAMFYVFLEIAMITAVCAAVRRPMSAHQILEAYAVTVVLALYLTGLGNLTSTHAPRAVNPSRAMRTGSPGKLQALLLLLYPLGAIPVALAFAARYAFDSEVAFFVVLFITGLIGLAVYWVALEAAVETAEKNRERILTALSQGEGLLQA